MANNPQDLISSILSDPGAMAKLQSLGKELGLTGDSTGLDTPQQNAPQGVQGSANQGGFDLSSLTSLLSGGLGDKPQPIPASNPISGLLSGNSSISPELLSSAAKLLPMLSSINKEDDTTVLLNALRPFLSPRRQKRLEEAARLLRIMRLLPMIRSAGLF